MSLLIVHSTSKRVVMKKTDYNPAIRTKSDLQLLPLKSRQSSSLSLKKIGYDSSSYAQDPGHVFFQLMQKKNGSWFTLTLFARTYISEVYPAANFFSAVNFSFFFVCLLHCCLMHIGWSKLSDVWSLLIKSNLLTQFARNFSLAHMCIALYTQ